MLLIAGLAVQSVAAFLRTDARTARSPCDAFDVIDTDKTMGSNALKDLSRLPVLKMTHDEAAGPTVNILNDKMKTGLPGGGPTLVVFWSTACSGCLAQLSSFLQTARRWKNHGGSTFLVAVDDDFTTLNRFFASHPALLHPAERIFFVWDKGGKARKSFGVSKYPETYILDKNGTIIFKVEGERDWNSTAARKCLLHAVYR